MEFEYDAKKNMENLEKHGINFIEAQNLWSDTDRIVIPAKSLTEPRYLLIGKIGRKYWSAIYTIRKNKFRLISVRTSRKNERKIYES